jgi:mannosyltransferase
MSAAAGTRPRRWFGRGTDALATPAGPGPVLRSWWIVPVVFATALTGLIQLGTKSLWHDEAYSVAMAELGSSAFFKALLHQEAFSGLYYLVLRPWSMLGDSETWLRLPSVAFGVLAACMLFALNRRLFGSRVATIATILLAVNVFYVEYLQEARAYSMAMCAVVLATYLFVIALERPSIGRWAAYGLVAAIAIYAHAFAAFVIVGHLASLLVRRPRVTSAGLGFGLAAVLIAPLLVLLVAAPGRGPDPGLGSIESAFLELTGGGGVRTRGSRALLLGYFFASCIALVSIARPSWRQHLGGARSPDRWSYVLIIACLALPVVGGLTVSVIRPIFLPRYLIVTLPWLVTLAALGIAALPHPTVRVAAVATLVLLSIPWLLSYYRADLKNGEDWRRAVTDVVQAQEPGDGIVFLTRFGRRPFEYYLERFDGEKDLEPVYPSLPWDTYAPVLTDEHFASAAQESARLEGRFERVWVVLLWRGFDSPNEGGRALEAALDDGYREAWRRSYGHSIDVILYVREPTPSRR